MDITFASIRDGITSFFSKYFYVCVVLVCAIVGVLGWFGVLRGAYVRIQQSGVLNLQTANTALAKRQVYLDDLKEMSEAYSQLNSEQLSQLPAVLPTQVDEISLLNTMYDFAAAAHVRILSIDVVLSGNAAEIAAIQKKTQSTQAATASISPAAPLVSNPNVNIANVVMNVEPEEYSYESFKAFLSILDHFSPVLNLRQITYSPRTTSYALQLETYYTKTSSQ